VGNILGFERDFPDCTVIRLEQNYRSTRTILEAANEVVGRNPDRTGKRLWTENPQGEPIRLETLADDLEESRYIADTIVELHRQGRPLRDMAVFYRTNAQSRSLEEAMVARRLPYAVFGGVKFFARMEVKDILAYLRLLVNPADSLSAKRIVNVPTRGIGKTTVERIDAHSDAAGGFYPACRLVLERGELSGAAAKRVAEFVALIEGFRERLATVDYPELTKQVIDETGYGAVLQAERTEEARDRLHNLQELVNGMEEHRGREATLADYLEQVALVTDLDSYDPSLDRVILMTLHAAKGLEFPVVFIAGMEDGLFPGARALPGSEELAEERRLCYVGMTRAMQRLYLSHARRRRIYGSYQYNPPSPFLAEIPPQLLANAPPVAAAPHNLASAFEAAPRTAGDGGHNLAAVFSQPPAETGEEAFEEPVRLVPEAEEGLRLGMKVRHAKFGVGVVRRIEGAGENTKVTIFFNTVGPKKLLLRFAGLEPA